MVPFKFRIWIHQKYTMLISMLRCLIFSNHLHHQTQNRNSKTKSHNHISKNLGKHTVYTVLLRSNPKLNVHASVWDDKVKYTIVTIIIITNIIVISTRHIMCNITDTKLSFPRVCINKPTYFGTVAISDVRFFLYGCITNEIMWWNNLLFN